MINPAVILAANTLEAMDGGWWRIGMTGEEALEFLSQHDDFLVPLLAQLRECLRDPEQFGPGRFAIGKEYSRVIYFRLGADGVASVEEVSRLAATFEADECSYDQEKLEFRFWWD